MRARFNPETFNPTDYELNYDPQHGPRDDWREVVMQGFMPAPMDAASAPGTVRRGAQPALTEAQKTEIVRLWAFGHGVSVNKLAQQFGVHNRTIDEVLAKAGLKKITPRRERKGRS